MRYDIYIYIYIYIYICVCVCVIRRLKVNLAEDMVLMRVLISKLSLIQIRDAKTAINPFAEQLSASQSQ